MDENRHALIHIEVNGDVQNFEIEGNRLAILSALYTISSIVAERDGMTASQFLDILQKLSAAYEAHEIEKTSAGTDA